MITKNKDTNKRKYATAQHNFRSLVLEKLANTLLSQDELFKEIELKTKISRQKMRRWFSEIVKTISVEDASLMATFFECDVTTVLVKPIINKTKAKRSK